MKCASAKFGLTTVAMALAIAANGPAYAACENLVAAFDRAVASNSIDDAQRAATAVANDIVCGDRADEFQGRLVQFLIARAGAATTPAAERARAIAIATDSLQITGTWRNAMLLADYFMRRGERPKALAWYEKSLSLQSLPGAAATPAEWQALLRNAAAAKLLANDDQEGKRAIAFADSTRDTPDGKLGGIYAPLRGIGVVAVPLPINFFTDETRFTPTGEQAIKELTVAAREQQLGAMKLVGHADPRGEPGHNMDLSRRRVEAVRDALVRSGVGARITLDWKGAQQPIDPGVLPFRPSQEEIWALDRRVEWFRDGKAN
jgi:outer membrane protein OmpA-like peptidoglycan-associated protein